MKCSAVTSPCRCSLPLGRHSGTTGTDERTGTTTCGLMSRAIGRCSPGCGKTTRSTSTGSRDRQCSVRAGSPTVAFRLRGMGSISDKVSFRMFPVIYEDGLTFAGHGWIRYNQAFGTDWVNIKVGQSGSMSRSTRARVQHG